jgi:cytochrome c-type biogenesis protein CcmH
LLKEYRCLKCQNQNLADSNASLAGDLRREIREQILAGKSRDDIDGYLVARYGEFVLYRPRFNMKTAILWLGPFLLLLVGLASVYAMSRRRALTREQRLASATGTAAGNEELAARLEKARRLLND